MKNKSKNKVMLPFIVVATVLISAMELNAQDFPRWRGANNDAIYKGAGLNLDFSAKKPSLLWTFRQAGSGYSSPVIVGTTLYMSGAADGKDFAFALDAQTGKLKWKQELGEVYVQDRGDGPRGTITIDGNRLYLIRGAGQIHCLSTDGKMIWQKDFVKDFGGKIMSQWGYSESPLVDGDLVICTPGSSMQGTLFALDKNTGATVWACKEWTDEAGYSSPIVAEINGVRQYIQQSNKGVAGVSAKDGKLLWRVEVEGYRTAIIPTPLYQDDIVYVTASYNAGSTAIRLTKTGDKFNTEIIYTNNKNMVNHHGGVVLLNGYIYGYSEPSGWACQNLKSGEQVWSQRIKESGKGAVLVVNDRMLLFDERTGTLTVAAASPEGWKEFGRMEIPERTQMLTMDNMIWAHPVVANGKLYLRDHDLLFCFDLKK